MRTARCILIFLFLGAVLNIAFTWSVAGLHRLWDYRDHRSERLQDRLKLNQWIGHIDSSGYFDPTDDDPVWVEKQVNWFADVYDSFPREPYNNSELLQTFNGDLPYWFDAVHPPQALRFISLNRDIVCGWPFRTSGFSVHNLTLRTTTNQVSVNIRGGISLHNSSRTAVYYLRIIPTIPIWKGIILNSLFWAVIFTSFFYGLRHLRHRHRIRRGRCPRCAYPMGTSPACTECGTALPASAVNTTHS
jgi:hypothetical protein